MLKKMGYKMKETKADIRTSNHKEEGINQGRIKSTRIRQKLKQQDET